MEAVREQRHDGRGVVLIGHSQGSGHLRRLIAEEVDGDDVLGPRLVSALLLGTTVSVPDGEVVGGDFAEIPACTEEGEVACVISYASFRATAPPPPTTFFGQADGTDRALCTNPGSLTGGTADLEPYFQASVPAFSADAAEPAQITTNWVTLPDFLTAECIRDGDVDYLEVTIDADPDDPRTDDITGDLTPEWGLHIVDANIAMGNLIDVVAAPIAICTGD
jgi:hypothetical protein